MEKVILSFSLLFIIIMCLNLPVEATENDAKPYISRGTLNIAIGNRNCVVVATDSRATIISNEGQWQGEQDDHQKLFKISDNIVVTIAGYGSGAALDGKFTVAASLHQLYFNILKN